MSNRQRLRASSAFLFPATYRGTIAAFLLIALSFLAPIRAAAQVVESKVFSEAFQWQALRATVRLTAYRAQSVGYCSGAVIAQDQDAFFVASSPHCFNSDETSERPTLIVEAFDEKALRVVRQFSGVEIIATDAESEFALLRVPGRFPYQVLPLCPSNRIPQIGTAVLSIGCGGGSPPTAEVNRIVTRDQRHWVVEQVGTKGRSGGPLISSDGFVIGCCCCGGGGTTYYSELRRMHDVLDTVGLSRLYRPDAPTSRPRPVPEPPVIAAIPDRPRFQPKLPPSEPRRRVPSAPIVARARPRHPQYDPDDDCDDDDDESIIVGSGHIEVGRGSSRIVINGSRVVIGNNKIVVDGDTVIIHGRIMSTR